MFQGLRTAIYPVGDVEEAKAWYAEVLGFGPYFDQPFYVGFEVGGYELGLIPAKGDSQPGATGVVAYWGVPEAEAALDHLLERGAQRDRDIQDVGEGIKVATVRDPWGNVFGIIENPHFRIR
jgi:predicted enzyme related to lactoylglutathione lyase